MHMCVTTILYTAIMVFAITGIGFAIGKLNKFGDSDELVNLDDKQGGRQNDYNTDLDVMFCRSYGSADDPVSCVESDGKEKQGRAVTPVQQNYEKQQMIQEIQIEQTEQQISSRTHVRLGV